MAAPNEETRKSVERVWTRRWKSLRAAGLTAEQAELVYDLMNETHTFGYEWLAVSAWRQLVEVYADE